MTVLMSCAKIFFCRILDVTFGTMKTVLTVKERTKLAALFGFVEVFIWYIVVRDALSGDAPMLVTALSYAGGYAAGTFVGGRLSQQLVSGQLTMQVITSSRDVSVVEALRRFGFGLSVIHVNEGINGKERYMILATIDKRQKNIFETNVRKVDPDAFIIVQNTSESHGGYDKAKILSKEDYAVAFEEYRLLRRKHPLLITTRMANHFSQKFNISFTQAVSILQSCRKDYREKKSKEQNKAAGRSEIKGKS